MAQTAAGLEPSAIESESPAAAAALRRLGALVVGAGGSVLPGTVFRVERGDLTVHRAAAETADAPLIAVPEACLPATKAFRVRLARGRFEPARAPDGPPPTPAQAAAFAELIALYNALDKPRQWSLQSPWLTLWNDPALLCHLAGADRLCGHSPELARYRAGQWARLLVDSFLRARAFALRPASGGRACDVLLPLLDALDHDDRAARFARAVGPGPDGTPVPLVQVPQARPVAGSDACRVAYSRIDARAALLHYGFLDTSAPYVLSVPATVAFAGGARLCVVPATGRYTGQLPPELAALRGWMPRVLRAPPDLLAVTRLAIPPAGARDTLCAVLTALLAEKWPDWDAARRAEAAAAASRAILAANRRHHARTADLLAAAHARSGGGDVPGRRATLAALDRWVRRTAAHVAC